MKKLLSALLIAVITFTSFSFTSVAKAADYVGGGDPDVLYAEAVVSTKNERTDIYAIDYYRGDVEELTRIYPYIAEQANKIVYGITDDYEKAKAIFEWVRANVTYAYEPSEVPEGLKGLDVYKYGNCVCFADITVKLLWLVGLPAKVIEGGAYSQGYWGGHNWNEVYVDNRWVYIDSTWGEFDLPMKKWSRDHSVVVAIINLDARAWNGSLYFLDPITQEVYKEVKKFPFNGLVTATYGLDINKLYIDAACTKPFTLNTMQVNAGHCVIYVKEEPVVPKYKITFKANSGTKVKDMTITADSKITKPSNPTRKGYTFRGWYIDSSCTRAWNFTKNKVNSNLILHAGWKKK